MTQISVREAVPEDCEAVADVFTRSLQLLAFLPQLHTAVENRRFVADVIFRDCLVLVAVHRRRIISFLALEQQEIRLLHTHPAFIGRGAGTLLVKAVQNMGLDLLELWCFQENHGARQFYERNGFTASRFTGGSGNEEKIPDIRYHWKLPTD